MSIWVDQPSWPRHGTVFAHLISDESLAELHELARRAGLSPRSFEGDHYDVPQERYAAVLAAGATSVTGRELVRRLLASGLRLRKRRGDHPVARLTDVVFADGTRADVDLVASPQVIDRGTVFAAMVFLRDGDGRFAVVHSPRREAWGSPGGWLELGESAAGAAVREVMEETGIGLSEVWLRACAYERFEITGEVHGRWLRGRSYLQVFLADLPGAGPTLRPALDDVDEARWAGFAELEQLCGSQFWWPLMGHLFPETSGRARH